VVLLASLVFGLDAVFFENTKTQRTLGGWCSWPDWPDWAEAYGWMGLLNTVCLVCPSEDVVFLAVVFSDLCYSYNGNLMSRTFWHLWVWLGGRVV
jgi:hypothetical protein